MFVFGSAGVLSFHAMKVKHTRFVPMIAVCT